MLGTNRTCPILMKARVFHEPLTHHPGGKIIEQILRGNYERPGNKTRTVVSVASRS